MQWSFKSVHPITWLVYGIGLEFQIAAFLLTTSSDARRLPLLLAMLALGLLIGFLPKSRPLVRRLPHVSSGFVGATLALNLALATSFGWYRDFHPLELQLSPAFASNQAPPPMEVESGLSQLENDGRQLASFLPPDFADSLSLPQAAVDRLMGVVFTGSQEDDFDYDLIAEVRAIGLDRESKARRLAERAETAIDPRTRAALESLSRRHAAEAEQARILQRLYLESTLPGSPTDRARPSDQPDLAIERLLALGDTILTEQDRLLSR